MALFFNGTSDYVSATQPAASVACSVSCWVNFTTLTDPYSPLCVQLGGVELGPTLYVTSAGKIAIYFGHLGAYSFYDGTGTNTLSVNTLYHVAATYDPTAGTVGYVNGAVDGTFANIGNLSTQSSCLFGIDTDFANRHLNGSLSHMALWSTALTAAQVGLLASGLSPLTVNPQTLTGYWPLDGIQPARDRGPRSALATINGPRSFTDPALPIAYPDLLLAPMFDEGEMPVLFAAASTSYAAFSIPQLDGRTVTQMIGY